MKMYWDLITLTCLLFSLELIKADDGYFWHVTDFHYDPTYNETSLSCKKDKVDGPLGPFGDKWCDSPWALITSSVLAMKNIKPDVDFLLWTGDTVLHGDVEKLNHTFNAAILDNTTDILKTSFPNIPVYATFGNHDAYPQDQFPPKNSLLYNETHAMWRSWINDITQDSNFRKGGFYTVKTTSGIRIVALNTNLYYHLNKRVQPDGDPAGQFEWLTHILQEAKKTNEKVIVTAHIAPGVTRKPDIQLFSKQNDRLVGILKEFADVIVAMHFGHEHADAFKVLKNNQDIPSIPVFLAPSISPLIIGAVHNPGIRLVRYDRTTGEHLELSQYYLDLFSANEGGHDDWKLEYSTSNVYKLPDLSAASLNGLIGRLKDPNSNDFEKYKTYYVVSPPERFIETCEMRCHAVTWCAFSEFTVDDVENCVQEMASRAHATQITYWGYLLCISVMLILFNCNIVL